MLLLFIYMSAGIITPVFGLIIDRIGKRVHFIIGSSCIFIIAHIFLITLPEDANLAYIIIILLLTGLFYGSYAAFFWPCIPLTVFLSGPQF
jgi:MFS family permease